MSNQGIENNGVNGIGTTGKGVAPGMHRVPDLASAGCHEATDQKKERMKWKKAAKKMFIDCWIRSQHTKRKYRQQLKKIWNGIGVSTVTEQRFGDQARQIRTNVWLQDIEEIRRHWERSNSTVEVQEDDQK